VHVGIAEPVANDLQAAGIRVRLRALERAAYNKGQVEKTFKNLVLSASAAFGSAPTGSRRSWWAAAPTCTAAIPTSTGSFRDRHRARSQAPRVRLHRIQQLMHEKAMFAPIWQLRRWAASGRGWRNRVSAHHRIPVLGPYEDVKLKAN
jgi:peptide/nickel transport system substrate-binding protein